MVFFHISSANLILDWECHCLNSIIQFYLQDYVVCPVCHVRFKTFLIMQRHKDKQHKQQIQIVSTFTQKPALGNSDLFLQCETERKVETSTELRDRILAESRRISVVRPPGRPPKVRLQSPSMEQNSTPKIKMNFPRPPAIQRRDSSTSSIEDGRSPRYQSYIT